MLRSIDTADTELLGEISKLHQTTSARIRALHAAGWPRSKIAKALGKRYQHVRGVLIDDERRLAAASPKPVETRKVAQNAMSPVCDSEYLHAILKNTRQAVKRPLNLSFNSSLLEAAKLLNINLTELLERRVVEVLKQEAMSRWQAENREAIEASNQFVERNGLWSDGLRQF